MIWLVICSRTVGFLVSTSVSTLRFRFRSIQSADEMKTRAFADGRRLPFPKQTIRECSRNLPTIDLTRMLSDRPRIPGLRPQIPLTMRLILTPAWLAAYSASITSGSMSEFIFAQISAGRPLRARSASAPMQSISRDFRSIGDIDRFSKLAGVAYPET